MTWNYRVVRTKAQPLEGFFDEYSYGISEVYYDREGEVYGWTEPEVSAESLNSLGSALSSVLLALDKPVIDGDQPLGQKIEPEGEVIGPFERVEDLMQAMGFDFKEDDNWKIGQL